MAGESSAARRHLKAVLLLLCLPALGLAVPQARGYTQGTLTGFIGRPTDQIAVPGLPGSAELTPEGNLYTGWAEYELRYGPHLRPWDQPTRTLADPSLPSFSSTLSAGALRYTQTVFAVSIAGEPVAYRTLTVSNRSAVPRIAQLEMAIAYTKAPEVTSPDGGIANAYRFQRPVGGGPLGSYQQPGEAFSRAFAYSFEGRDYDRSGLLLARGPAARSVPVATPPLSTPSAPHDARLYEVRLKPHSSATVTWQIPLDPPTATATADGALGATTLQIAKAQLRREWSSQEAGMMGISLPEQRVSSAYEAALVQILDSRISTPAGIEQCPNRLQYQAFWIRDAAIETDALDLAGLHATAADNLAFIDAFQQPDGLFLSQTGQYDGLGEALWATAQHALLAQDATYAGEQLPRAAAAVGWLTSASTQDPLGLLPPSNPADNELAYGHITGDDLWAAAGLRSAVRLAQLAGDAQLAASWHATDELFESSLNVAIEAAFAREGHIPPVLDAAGGQDWGNYWASFPAEVLSATSPAVQATLTWAKTHSIQGLPTYADGKELHDYLGFRLFETDLEAGDPAAAVAGLYAELAHTTSTYAGWETIPNLYGARSSQTNLAPHGTFAAEYVALLRKLLLREAEDGEVLLLSGASPAWLAPGEHVSVSEAPTAGGTISFTERSTARGERLTWRDDFPAGTTLRWVLPHWATGARMQPGGSAGASLQASSATATSASVLLGGDAGSVTISFHGAPPKQSYARTVAALNRGYAARGQPPPLAPVTASAIAR